MGLDFAIDELYASGWNSLNSAECESVLDGRWIPTLSSVLREFESAGLTLGITHVQLFDCFRATWSDDAGIAIGSVVGQTEQEAAIYALAQMRRSASTIS